MKRNSLKKALAMICAIALTGSLAACGGGTDTPEKTDKSGDTQQTEQTVEPMVIRLSHAYSEMDQINVELKNAAERIAERTNGAIDLQVYANSTLTMYNDAVEALMSDAPLMYMSAHSQWVDYYPDACALQTGFVFDSVEEVKRFYETDMCAEINAALDEYNIHCVAPGFISGMRHIVANKQITSVDDLKGMKIRTPASVTWTELFEALGAAPMGMAASEQVNALTSGTIDATEQSIGLIYSTKTWEVVKDVTLTAHMPVADSLFCSTNFWNTIDEEYQTIIEEELTAAANNYYDYAVEKEADQRAELESNGVKFYEVDRTPFIEATKQNILQYSIGQDVMDSVAQIRADIAAGK